MARTWNRDVYDVGFLYLTVTGSNPGNRHDTADDITTFPPDRSGTGAKINYHAKSGVVLTGIEMKDKGSIPAEMDVQVRANGKLLRVVVKNNAPGRTEWSYYVRAGTKSTRDPRIHNSL